MSSKSSQKAKEKVFEVCQEMQKAALVIGSSGNASLRIEDTDSFAISPSKVEYTNMCTEDILIIDSKGEVIEGDRNPSIEWPLHLAIYNARPDVNAIVHSHCLYASALAIMELPLPPIIDEFVIRLGGQIEVANYGFPGSQELAQNVIKALGPRNAVLIANHGAVCCGPTMDDALHNALLLERVAHIYLLAAAVDKEKISTLPKEAIETQQQLFEMMKRRKHGT
jgi:L-fuculose-phosphate aldolase